MAAEIRLASWRINESEENNENGEKYQQKGAGAGKKCGGEMKNNVSAA
jgi:hypothetical protein